MFWGSFKGSFKGPCPISDKDWDKIKFANCCKKKDPVLENVLSKRPSLILMQDNAPANSLAESNGVDIRQSESRVKSVYCKNLQNELYVYSS